MTKEDERLLHDIHERINRVTVRCEALRVSLEQSDPEFRDRFQANLNQLDTFFREQIDRHLVERLEDEKHRLIHQLLESHEGTKQ